MLEPRGCFTCHMQGACVRKLSSMPKIEDPKATKQIVALLTAPLEKYSNVITALTLSNYPCIMNHLDRATNKVMAMVILQSILKNETYISAASEVCVYNYSVF